MSECCVCGRADRELRPYGPDGKPICFPCATSPARAAETERQFRARLDACGPLAVLTGDGPARLDPRDLP